jgi:hypothetical protein
MGSKLSAPSTPDLSTTLAADGNAVILFAVNDQHGTIERPLDFSAFGRESQAVEFWTLADSPGPSSPPPPKTSTIRIGSHPSARRERRHPLALHTPSPHGH